MEDSTAALQELYSRERKLSSHGHDFTFTCQDPYGFWTVRLDKARKQPEIFNQQFTSIDMATRTAVQWADANKTSLVVDAPTNTIKKSKSITE